MVLNRLYKVEIIVVLNRLYKVEIIVVLNHLYKVEIIVVLNHLYKVEIIVVLIWILAAHCTIFSSILNRRRQFVPFVFYQLSRIQTIDELVL